MCGIAVVTALEARADAMVECVERMHADLHARGPDGEGWLVVDTALRARRFGTRPPPAALPDGGARLAAAFRRLATRDTRAEAGQPLAVGDRIWVLHNGEIYNDADLRSELSARGLAFATRNDAETVAAAYGVWGAGCFERLRGMWATVIVDLARGCLVASRDRLGIKPLFVSVDGPRTLIASLARTVALARDGGPRLDERRWRRFLGGRPARSTDGSFFAGVTAVPPGAYITFDLGGTRPAALAARRYWHLGPCVPDQRDVREAPRVAEELFELLEASTREHLIADRPVGCMLSGGVDSSLVTALAARVAGGAPPAAYSIVYDDERMSEWPYVKAVAAHVGVTSVTHTLTPSEAWALVDEVVAAHGEPLLGQDAIAHYRAFRLAGQHGAVVALEGQGADEVFAGLPQYEAVMFREWIEQGRWGRVLSEARARARARTRSTWWALKQYALGPLVQPWWSPPPEYSWIEGTEEADDGSAWGLPPDEPARASRLHRWLFTLVRHTNLPAVLLIQDRNAMAHGVENRPPFLDHRLVEWAFRLLPSHKVGSGRRKRVVWEAASRVLPSMVLNRTDKRAIVSRADWLPLRRDHAEALRAMADGLRMRQAPLIAGDRMAGFVRAYLQGRHDDGAAVWRLYTGWRWLERFGLT